MDSIEENQEKKSRTVVPCLRDEMSKLEQIGILEADIKWCYSREKGKADPSIE